MKEKKKAHHFQEEERELARCGQETIALFLSGLVAPKIHFYWPLAPRLLMVKQGRRKEGVWLVVEVVLSIQAHGPDENGTGKRLERLGLSYEQVFGQAFESFASVLRTVSISSNRLLVVLVR